MTDPRGIILKFLGGTPLNKVKTVFMEKFPVVKRLDGGPLGSLLGSVLSSGPAAIMQNPIASVSASLTSTINSAVSQVTAALGSDSAALVSALTGSTSLSSSLSALVSHTGLLSGVTALGEGQFGPHDIIAHADFANTLGSWLPVALGIDKAIAPLLSSAQLSSTVASVASIGSAVAAGTMSVTAGTAAVNALTSNLNGLTTASLGALQGAQNAGLTVATISAVAAAAAPAPIKAPSTPAEDTVRMVMRMIVQPSALAQMDTAVATHAADTL